MSREEKDEASSFPWRKKTQIYTKKEKEHTYIYIYRTKIKVVEILLFSDQRCDLINIDVTKFATQSDTSFHCWEILESSIGSRIPRHEIPLIRVSHFTRSGAEWQGVLVRFDTRVNVTRHFPLIAGIQRACTLIFPNFPNSIH